MMKEIFKYTLDGSCGVIKSITSSDKETKKLTKLMGGVLEMVSIFMEDNHELTQSLHEASTAFSIP
jgi:ribosomal protein S2